MVNSQFCFVLCAVVDQSSAFHSSGLSFGNCGFSYWLASILNVLTMVARLSLVGQLVLNQGGRLFGVQWDSTQVVGCSFSVNLPGMFEIYSLQLRVQI